MASTLVNSRSGIVAILIRDWLSIAGSLFASKPKMTWSCQDCELGQIVFGNTLDGEPRLRLLGPEFRVYNYPYIKNRRNTSKKN